jgi:type I restriction enzyme M protein
MLGAIIGDIVGSRFEWRNIKTKEFEFFAEDSFFTDDSVMTLAIAQAILSAGEGWRNLGQEAVKRMRRLGRRYEEAGYGPRFKKWLFSDDPQPYGSYGNGSAMRVSPCGLAACSLEETKLLSRLVTEVTHDHPEGLKGAEAVAVCVFMARTGHHKDEIRDRVVKNYYPLDFTLDSIREAYRYDVTCPGTVPQALAAFFESADFEDSVRGAVSLGGDSDTMAAITGGVSEAYYGLQPDMVRKALSYLDPPLVKIVDDFTAVYPGGRPGR